MSNQETCKWCQHPANMHGASDSPYKHKYEPTPAERGEAIAKGMERFNKLAVSASSRQEPHPLAGAFAWNESRKGETQALAHSAYLSAAGDKGPPEYLLQDLESEIIAATMSEDAYDVAKHQLKIDEIRAQIIQLIQPTYEVEAKRQLAPEAGKPPTAKTMEWLISTEAFKPYDRNGIYPLRGIEIEAILEAYALAHISELQLEIDQQIDNISSAEQCIYKMRERAEASEAENATLREALLTIEGFALHCINEHDITCANMVKVQEEAEAALASPEATKEPR
jgi:hypothetical protein